MEVKLEMLVKAIKSGFMVGGTLLIMAGLSYAKSYKIDVIYPAIVGSSARLHPGTYQVKLMANGGSSRLAFFNRNGRRVASVPVTVKSESRKNQYTEVDYNKLTQNEHAITAIRPGGQSEAFILPSGGKMMSGHPSSGAVKEKKSGS